MDLFSDKHLKNDKSKKINFIFLFILLFFILFIFLLYLNSSFEIDDEDIEAAN